MCDKFCKGYPLTGNWEPLYLIAKDASKVKCYLTNFVKTTHSINCSYSTGYCLARELQVGQN